MKLFSLLAILILIFLSSSCYKKYSRTIKVCDGSLFVELYKHKYIDVAYEYLTDSGNFRMYVGRFDYEHANYSYNCQGGSLRISEWYEGKVINIRNYHLNDLRKGKKVFK